MSIIESGSTVRRLPPLTVRFSKWLWLSSSLVGGVLPLALSHVFIPAGESFTSSIVTCAVITTVQTAAALVMPRGANWARNILAIIAVFSVLGAATTFLGPGSLSAPAMALILTCLPLTVVASVLMWLPSSRRYLDHV